MRTTAPRLGSRSARVPESLRSLPVSSGTGFSLFGSSGLFVLNRYQVVLAGVPVPGQTTAPVPHETTTVFFGTPNATYEVFVFLLVVFDCGADSESAVILSFLAAADARSSWRVFTGPAISFFVLRSNRYHLLAPFSFTSACWPESSE